jgi:hypothetical protein
MELRVVLVAAVTLRQVLAVLGHQDKAMRAAQEAQAQLGIARAAAAVRVLLVKLLLVLLLPVTAVRAAQAA